MVLDQLFPSIKLQSFLEWTRTSFEQFLAEFYTVTDLLKAFLGNGSVNTVNVQQWEMCVSGRMLLRVARQQRTSEDGG
jgi:hypothetical protein